MEEKELVCSSPTSSRHSSGLSQRAMASLGAPVLPHMPDFSLSNDPFSTPGDMKSHLQHLLDSKEKQLQQAGLLGQRVLAQQADLDELMRQLQEMEAEMADADDDSIEHEARLRYNELADKIVQWDRENAQLSSIFGVSSSKVREGIFSAFSFLTFHPAPH